jgi:Epoxide hydrolase N terminus
MPFMRDKANGSARADAEIKLTPFRIDIPQADLDDLVDRLHRTRWTDEYEGVGWDYGTNLGYLKELATYWQYRYDGRRQEPHLNSFPHYTAELAGEALTFIHARGTGPNPTPLLLLHGWPDSICRCLKLIPLLTDPAGHGRDPGGTGLPRGGHFVAMEYPDVMAADVRAFFAELTTRLTRHPEPRNCGCRIRSDPSSGRFAPDEGRYDDQIARGIATTTPGRSAVQGHAAANHSTIGNTEAAPARLHGAPRLRRREERVMMPRHGVSHHCMAAAKAWRCSASSRGRLREM